MEMWWEEFVGRADDLARVRRHHVLEDGRERLLRAGLVVGRLDHLGLVGFDEAEEGG